MLEIKCPYSVRETTPTSVSYFIEETEGVFKLSKQHKYYYQIQGQMSILEVLYCDFVCWTPHCVHLERIAYDIEFVNNMIPQLTCFFLGVILPEILWAVKEPASSTETYCVCQQGESGKMIACDSTECGFIMVVLISPITLNQVMQSGFVLIVQEKHFSRFVVIYTENVVFHDLLPMLIGTDICNQCLSLGQAGLPFATTNIYIYTYILAFVFHVTLARAQGSFPPNTHAYIL